MSISGTGKVFSDEHRKNIGKASKGRKFSEESKRKMSVAHKAENLSLEMRKRMSVAQKNRMVRDCHPMKGKKHTEESKKRISLSNFGKKRPLMTLEHRRKLSESHRGSKSHNWKGGITVLQKRLRSNFKYRQWRSDNLTRDNFTCQICGEFSVGGLNVDHYPKAFAEILRENKITSMEQALECEELWNLNNGRTLCIRCHMNTDTYGGKRKKVCGY